MAQPKPETQVADGQRTGRPKPENGSASQSGGGDPNLAAAAAAVRSFAGADLAEGEKLYQSFSRNFQVQINPGRIRVANDGERVIEPPVIAKFVNGFFRTSDPETIAKLEFETDRSGKVTSRAKKNFGIGRDFWLVSDMQTQVQESVVASAVAALQGNPAARAEVLRMLRSDELPVQP